MMKGWLHAGNWGATKKRLRSWGKGSFGSIRLVTGCTEVHGGTGEVKGKDHVFLMEHE